MGHARRARRRLDDPGARSSLIHVKREGIPRSYISGRENVPPQDAVYLKGGVIRAEWRLSIPNVCGKCHGKERDAYVTSVHGDETLMSGIFSRAQADSGAPLG